jgi:hypothetical protein
MSIDDLIPAYQGASPVFEAIMARAKARAESIPPTDTQRVKCFPLVDIMNETPPGRVADQRPSPMLPGRC